MSTTPEILRVSTEIDNKILPTSDLVSKVSALEAHVEKLRSYVSMLVAAEVARYNQAARIIQNAWRNKGPRDREDLGRIESEIVRLKTSVQSLLRWQKEEVLKSPPKTTERTRYLNSNKGFH